MRTVRTADFRDKNKNGTDDRDEPTRGYSPTKRIGGNGRWGGNPGLQSAAARRIAAARANTTQGRARQAVGQVRTDSKVGNLISQARNKGQQGNTMSARMAQLQNLRKGRGGPK